MAQEPVAEVDPKLLELLCCPLTHGRLVHDAGTHELVSVSAKLAYPVREDVPIMLVSEARNLDEDELGRYR